MCIQINILRSVSVSPPSYVSSSWMNSSLVSCFQHFFVDEHLHLVAFGCISLHLHQNLNFTLSCLCTSTKMCSTSFAGKIYSHWNVFSDSCVYWKLVIVLELIVQCTSNKHERQNVEMKIRTGKCDGERSELYNFKQSWCLSPPPHLEDVGTELSPVDATTLLGKSLAWLQIIGFSSENGIWMERIKSDKILESK